MAASIFLSITPEFGSRLPTNSSFEIKYSGAELNPITEYFILFEDVDGNPVKFTVSSVEYADSVSTFTITPVNVLEVNSYYEITLLTSITNTDTDPIAEKTFKFVTRSTNETATIETGKVGQVNDVYYKKNLISDLLDIQDIIINGSKYNFSYIPTVYDPSTYTYSEAGDSYLLHDMSTFFREQIKTQYFKGYEQYFDNLESFNILTDEEFLNIEKALYPRSNDLARSSGLSGKIKFLLEIYAKASGKHFVIVEPDPLQPFRYYIISDVPNIVWSSTIKPLVNPIGWEETYIELTAYNVTYTEWLESTSYSIGDRIQIEGEDNEFWVLECSGDGTSSSSEPNWDSLDLSIGSFITDNGVTWVVIEQLGEVHNYETEKYQLTENAIEEYRKLLYIKGEGIAETVNYVETTTNLDLTDTGTLYLRAATVDYSPRIVRSSGSWTTDRIVSGSKIYINGATNDSTYTVDESYTQQTVFEDTCSSDNVDDWTLDTDVTVEFDKDHYEIKTDSTNQEIYFDEVSVVSGRTYKIEAYVKDGMASNVEFQFYFEGTVAQYSSTKKTSSSWSLEKTNILTEFISDFDGNTAKVGIKVLTNTSDLNFEIKGFVCTEMSQLELIEDDVLSDETIPISDSLGQSYQVISVGTDYDFESSGLTGTTQYYFKVNGSEFDITTVSDVTHSAIAELMDTELDSSGIGCTYDNLLGGYKIYSEDSSVTEILITSGTSGTDLITSITNYDAIDTALNYVGFDLNDTDEGLWIDGLLRPDPDTDEEVNDTSSNLYNPDAISPNYPSTSVPNWAHSVYENFLDGPRWSPSTAYVVGARININGYILTCLSPGNSGSTEPLWPFSFTEGETISDGTVIWGLSKLYNTDGWQANKSYYIGNKILVRSYICEVSVAGTSGSTEPTWPSTFSYNSTVTDNTVTWNVIEELETSRRDLLNVVNSIRFFPRFPLNYLEALPTAGVSDVSAIVYSTFNRPDLAYKDLSLMTEQYDGDPYAELNREEFAHVTQLKLVKGSGVSSFSNPGEDITFLYTSEDVPIVWIESTTFTTTEFSFGNTSLANEPDVTAQVVSEDDILIDSISAPDVTFTGSGVYYQTLTWNSSVNYSDISGIETGDILDLQSDTLPIDVNNQGEKIVWRHDHVNKTLKFINTSSGVLQASPAGLKADRWIKPTNYNMASFLIPGIFSFDASLLAGYSKLVLKGLIDPLNWKSTERFQYHYWLYDGGITFPDDDGTSPYTTFLTEIEDVDNFSYIIKDNLHLGSDILFKAYRINLNSIESSWKKDDLLFEYVDGGSGVPSSYDGTYIGKIEDVFTDSELITSDNALDDDSTDWTEEANITLSYNSLKYYELETTAANQHVSLGGLTLTQNHVYQIQANLLDESDGSINGNLSWFDGSSWQEGSNLTLDDSFTECSFSFTPSVTTLIGEVGIRVQTDMTALSDTIYVKDFTLYDITENYLMISFVNGVTGLDTSDYYSNYRKLPYDIDLTTDTTYTSIGTTDNIDPIVNGEYDRKVDVLFNYNDLFDYIWTVTPSVDTIVQQSTLNSLTFYVENTLATCSITLDVNVLNWRTDHTLTTTDDLTFDSEFNTLVRDTGDWSTDGVSADDVIYIEGTSYNDGYHIVKSVSVDTLILTDYSELVDETVSNLPLNVVVDDKVIQSWTMLYHTITPSTLTSL